MIQHVKDDPILQVSSQEPSVSSKYDFEDGGVLEALSKHARELKFGKINTNIPYNSLQNHLKVIFCNISWSY